MAIFFIIVFAVSVVYAVIGNLAVYIVLVRRGIRVRHMLAGTPGYLARICTESAPAAGPMLMRLARSTDIAFLVALFSGVGLAVTSAAA